VRFAFFLVFLLINASKVMGPELVQVFVVFVLQWRKPGKWDLGRVESCFIIIERFLALVDGYELDCFAELGLGQVLFSLARNVVNLPVI